MSNFGINMDHFQGNRTMRAIQEEYTANIVLNETARQTRLRQAFIDEEHRTEKINQEFQLRFKATLATNIQRRWRGVFFRHYSTFARRQRALRKVAVWVWIKNKLPDSEFLKRVRRNIRRKRALRKVAKVAVWVWIKNKLPDSEFLKRVRRNIKKRKVDAGLRNYEITMVFGTVATLSRVIGVAVAPFCPWGIYPMIASFEAVSLGSAAVVAAVDGTLLNLGCNRFFTGFEW